MDDEWEYETPSYPWSWRSSAVAVGGFVTNVLNAAATLSEYITNQLVADHNYRIDRRNFQESAALEIETIINEE